MGCRKYQAWLPLMADCLLSEKKQAQLDKHLETCPHCQKEATLYKSIVERCCQLPEVELPCDFYERLSIRLKRECALEITEPESKPWIWRMPLMIGSLSAAALLAVLIVLPEKNSTAPSTFITAFPTKSQAVKLAPLLNPAPPSRNENAKKTNFSPALPHRAVSAKENSTVLLTEKKRSLTDEQTEAALPSAGMGGTAPESNESAPVAQPQQSQLLRNATFGAPAQFVPAYSVPHTPPPAPSELEYSANTMVTDRLQTDIPLRPKPDCRVVRNPMQLQQAMEKSNQSAPLFTDLDWKKQMLAAIFLDPTLCPGYQLQLDAIEQMPDKIYVRYKIQRPTSVVPVNAPSPSLFLVLPYSDLPVEFAEQ